MTRPAYNSNNIFAKVLRDEIPSQRYYEDDYLIAIQDIEPAAPNHVLVLPRGEYVSYEDFCEHAPAEEIAHFFKTVRHIASDVLKLEGGYRLITNIGANASQTVPHFHVHILGGKHLGGLVPSDDFIR